MREYGCSFLKTEISTHASTQEATLRCFSQRSNNKTFQLTPPRRRRRTHYIRFSRAVRYFNSRLHAGGDIHNSTACCRAVISTHASTQEATAGLNLRTLQHYISTHASTQEATKNSAFDVKAIPNFNSRLHAGGDIMFTLWMLLHNNFNSRLHAGGDLAIIRASDGDYDISTHASTQEATV